jgi:predicted ferric reductase
VYPSDSFASNALDMSIAISVFLSALAVLLLWGHYLKYVGREPENSGRRLVLGKTLVCVAVRRFAV